MTNTPEKALDEVFEGTLSATPTRYRVEVIADSSGEWAGNGLTFDTAREASEYARDLASRWTLVRDWRVVKA